MTEGTEEKETREETSIINTDKHKKIPGYIDPGVFMPKIISWPL